MMNKEIEDAIRVFVKERDWEKFHSPKDLAISLSLEASELLEKFQWSGTDLTVAKKNEEMAEELADVFIYCFMMADALNVDAKKIIENKMEQNRRKYPVEKSFGNSKKYTEFE